MAEVLEQWMLKTMGYIVKLTAPDVGELLYDGTVFHDILCKYNIINCTKCPAPPRNPSTEVAVQSLADLGLWFKLLGIAHSKDLLESAARKNPRDCMRVLFELFAKLQTQDNTHFLMKQKAAEIQQAPSGRFVVTKAVEPKRPLDHPPPHFHLEDPLRERRGIVESYKATKERMENWNKQEMQRRRDVVKKWSERQTILSSEFEQASQQSAPPEDPIYIFNKYLEATKPKEESLFVTNKQYVAYLRQKRKKTSMSYVLKLKMQETLLHDLWTDILEERDKEITEVYQEILLQPCNYERKLTVTLEKLHDNYKNFSEFSSYINDLAEDEHSLAENLYQSNKKLQKEITKEVEMNRVLKLHKRLWDEKLMVKKEQHNQYCEKTVGDLVNHAIKLSEFRNEFHEDPPQKTLDEWKELFIKELPVLREPRSFVNQLRAEDPVKKPEILKNTIDDMIGQPGLPSEGVLTAAQAALQIVSTDSPEVVQSLPPDKFSDYPSKRVVVHGDAHASENVDWNILMDFSRSLPSSTVRLPYMLDLQTPHQSKDKLKVAEEENKKCEEDIECLLDRDVVDCVNNFNLRTYLNTIGPWDLKQWPDIWETAPFDEKLNVLGYVVHRLLDFKYPLPKGPKKPRLPNFQIKVILGKFSDPQVKYILESLRDLLAKEKVEIVDVSMPVNYCLKMYNEEMEITEVGSVLKTAKSLKESTITLNDENRSLEYKRWDKRPPRYPEKPPKRPEDLLPPPLTEADSRRGSAKSTRKSRGSRKSMASRKSKAGGSRKSVARKSKAGGSRKSVARKSKAGGGRKSVARKSKAGGARKSVARKSVARKSKVSSRKSMGGHRKSMGGKKPATATKPGSKKSLRKYLSMNKATQVPSLPDLRKRYKHSPAGKLGKVAFETLAEGKKINDAVLGNMLIEYLKTLDDRRGFVLVNFPMTALQANILEHQLGGLPIQYPMKSESEVDLFRTNEVTDTYNHLRCFLDFEKLLFDYVKEPEPPPDPIEAILAEDEEEENIKKRDKKGSLLKKKRKSMARKSVSRKSVARKSATARKSKTSRKSMARKSVARKSVAGKRKSMAGSSKGKSPDKDKKKYEEKKVGEAEEEPPPLPPPPPEEPPKPPLSLEQLNRCRISEILPRPNKDLDDLLYGTMSYFTKYVHPLQMQAFKADQSELARVKAGPFDHNPAQMLVNEGNKSYTFYRVLGLITDFDYMRFDLETIKRLVRVILDEVWDEDDITRKPSIELFGVGNLEKVSKGPPASDSSGSSKGSRASFYETKKTPKLLDLEANWVKTYKKYMAIKPPPPPPPSPPEPQPNPETIEDERKEKGRRKKLGGSRKSIKSKGSRKSMARKSVARKSVARKSVARKSVARKSVARKSVARKSKISQKRQSTAKRKSKAGSMKRKSVAGGGSKKSTVKSDQEAEKEPSIVLPPKPKPGDPDWIYINEPISYETGYTAATLWECAEYNYVENMESIFYLLRMHDMKILPYKEYVKAALQKAMEEESEKRHLVTNFQLMLNKVDDDYRHDDDMKHELYARAKELYDIMTVVATERRERSLIKKVELIGQGWVANQVYTLANLYLSMMQVELDLYVDSLQVLNDYYMGIMETIPKPGTHSKVAVAKNRMANEEEMVISRLSSTGGRRRRKTGSRSSLPPITLRHSLVIPMKIQQLLLKKETAPPSSASPTPPETNPTYPLISHVESFKGKIKELHNTYQGIINDPELGKELKGRKMGEWLKGPAGAADGLLALTGLKASSRLKGKQQRKSMGAKRKSQGGQRKSTASKRKSTGGQRKSQAGKRKSQAGKRKSQGGQRKSTASKRQSTGSKRKSSVKRQSSLRKRSKGGKSTKSSKIGKSDVEDEAPDMVDVAKEEWTAAVEYASRRAEFRLQLIEARAKKDLDRVLDIIKELFFEYQIHVDEQLINELAAIDQCMYVFKRAIEDGSPIQPLMVLDDKKFYVDRKILLFPDPPPPPPLPLVEGSNPYSFTVEQLTTLVNKFSRMAPMGVIETPMIQVLRELAIAGFESGKPTLPSAWAKLDSFDYKEIFIDAFSDQTCLDWRNFLIDIADIPYPTIEELQSLKKEYYARDVKREVIVTQKDFNDIRLWFENEFGNTIETDLKLSLAKPLIFNMFKINNDEMNYYDMLMGYCRAEDPEDGLGMALDLLLDSGFILQPEKCLREDEFDKIHPRKIIDFILVNFFTDLLNLTETVELKYLPRQTNMEVFASEENEFEISEDILRQNKGKRKDYGDLSSTDSETNWPKPERVLYLDDDDEMPAKYCCEKWQMCVPYEIALALILNALNYYALSPIHQHRILNVEQRLKDLYAERGTGTHIRAYRLTSSDLFKELYAKTNIFKKANIIAMVEKIIERKRESTGGKPSSELAKD